MIIYLSMIGLTFSGVMLFVGFQAGRRVQSDISNYHKNDKESW